MNGLLLVDKPSGITSHDVVDCIRHAAGMRRIGHTGTLDPAATGLLVLCLGTATRLSEHLTSLDKVYEGAMRLGIETDSYDMDGKIVAEREVPEFTLDVLQDACNRFVGEILQVPPMVSAVKVGGERLYKRARQGETVEREPRRVTVREFTVLRYTPPDVFIRVCCTRGTYVRSLCHDAGKLLGCGATLASLRRTRVGHHSVEEALPMASFTNRETVASRLLPMDSALDLPIVTVRPTGRSLAATGGLLGPADLMEPPPEKEGWVQIKLASGRLIALGHAQQTPAGMRIHAKRVLVD
ncbi:MAG TPA: tRNA pseudouridine(55) synthase TruB [Candidatus Hydrogenedentes bacterium]|nr:tRNA pseudouridine(55) synthase TruB [Candidatus Hydrogenedentota bacterium]